MTLETLELIGDCYRKALEKSTYSIDLPDNFSKELQSIKTKNNTETLQLNNYIHQLEICYSERKQTLKVTDLVEDMIFTAYHYVLWYNATHEKEIYVDLSFRRKSFESEFKKSLKRTLIGKSPRIKDRFGCRAIIRNKESEDINQNLMYVLTNSFIDLYCNVSSTKEDFIKWCSTNSSISPIAISRINEILSIPFELVEADQCYDTGVPNGIIIPKESGILDCFKYGVKDYAYTPKENGYQSVHFVLHIDSTSAIFPGLYIEFQVRTSIMHAIAEDKNSDAFHKNHKDDSSLVPVDDMEEKVSLDDFIKFDDWSKINLIGYDNHLVGDNNKNQFEDDSVGIRYAICPYTRKIASPHN